jgi:hypothetical protein
MIVVGGVMLLCLLLSLACYKSSDEGGLQFVGVPLFGCASVMLLVAEGLLGVTWLLMWLCGK